MFAENSSNVGLFLEMSNLQWFWTLLSFNCKKGCFHSTKVIFWQFFWFPIKYFSLKKILSSFFLIGMLNGNSPIHFMTFSNKRKEEHNAQQKNVNVRRVVITSRKEGEENIRLFFVKCAVDRASIETVWSRKVFCVTNVKLFPSEMTNPQIVRLQTMTRTVTSVLISMVMINSITMNTKYKMNAVPPIVSTKVWNLAIMTPIPNRPLTAMIE